MNPPHQFPIIPGYEILRCAGEGGMGAVFHAKRLSDGAQVAIKITHSADAYFQSRFALECETLASLEHPGISKYIEHGKVSGRPYLILEWLGDGSLADRLANGPLSPLSALAVTAAVADALQFMHQRGLIHRDIKPANILFRGSEPVLADLGIVRVAWSQLTQAGTVLGTPEYMSPEQIQGLEIDGSSDFYSLGVMLHEMLTGVAPFRANDSIETCKMHLIATPPPLPSTIEWIQPLVHSMMTKSREQRLSGSVRIRQAIQQLVDIDDDRLVELAIQQGPIASNHLERIYATHFPTVPSYTILRPAGHGGMATVYFGFSARLRRKVALKVLGKFSRDRKMEEARFKREAATLARISHPNVCRIYDSGIDSEQAYLVLEWLPTGTLEDQIVAGCTLAEILVWILQVSGALEHAHSLGIIHRDLKPANVMLRDGAAVLTDFGIARELGNSLSATGTVLGTPSYMSPEQIQGQRVNVASDIYSLGIVLYEMLTGRPPYTGETPAEVAMQHLVAPIPVLPQYYADLQPLLQQMLEKRTDQRIQTCASVVNELRRIVRESESLQRQLQNRSEGVSQQLNVLGVSLDWRPDARLTARLRKQSLRLRRWFNTLPKNRRVLGACLIASILITPAVIELIRRQEDKVISSEELDPSTRIVFSVLLSEFERSLEAGRLFEPEADSAARYLIDMRSVRRNAEITLEAEKRFLDTIAARALDLDKDNDPRAADALISGAEALFPTERITGLQAQLAEIRTQREYELRLNLLLARLPEATDSSRMSTLLTEALATELGPLRPQLQQALREQISGAFEQRLATREISAAQEWQRQLARVDAAAGERALQQLRAAEVEGEIIRLRQQLPEWRLADLGGLSAAAAVLERIEALGGDVAVDRDRWRSALDVVIESELARQRYDDLLNATEPYADRLSPQALALLATARAAKERRDLRDSLGTVALQVAPWGRVLAVSDEQGASVDLTRALSSRGDLRLPAGSYHIIIEDGWSRKQANLSVDIKARETTRLVHRFGEIDPDRYAELAGIAP